MVCETPLPFGDDVAGKSLGDISTTCIYTDSVLYGALYTCRHLCIKTLWTAFGYLVAYLVNLQVRIIQQNFLPCLGFFVRVFVVVFFSPPPFVLK